MFKVSAFFLLKKVWKCFKPFREHAKIRIFGMNIQAEGREPWVPWVPPGYPKNLGFSRVPGPVFRALGTQPHPSLRALLGGFEDPQNYGIPGPPRAPGVKNNGPSRPPFGTLF